MRSSGPSARRNRRRLRPGGTRSAIPAEPARTASSDNGRADRPQRPAVRPEDADPGRRTVGADPDEEHPAAHPCARSGRTPERGRGMGCWVRTAAGRGGPDPVRPARGGIPAPARPAARDGGFREAARAGQVAGAGSGATGTLPPPTRAPDERPPVPVPRAAGPGARCSPHWAGSCSCSRSPATGLIGLAVLGPAALALAVRGRRFRSGALARPGLRARLLRPAAVLDRHLRRPLPVAGPRGLGGAAPRAARRRHRADLAAAASGRCGPRRSGSPTRRCAAASSCGGFPWGRLGFSQTDGPAAVAGRLRRRAAGQLRGRAHRRPAGRGGAGAAPCRGAAADDPGQRGPALRAAAARRGRRPRRAAGRRAWPGSRCPGPR